MLGFPINAVESKLAIRHKLVSTDFCLIVSFCVNANSDYLGMESSAVWLAIAILNGI